MERLKVILSKYDREDAEKLKKIIEELCCKGIAKGCYQDYLMLADLIDMLSCLVCIVAEGELTE